MYLIGEARRNALQHFVPPPEPRNGWLDEEKPHGMDRTRPQPEARMCRNHAGAPNKTSENGIGILSSTHFC